MMREHINGLTPITTDDCDAIASTWDELATTLANAFPDDLIGIDIDAVPGAFSIVVESDDSINPFDVFDCYGKVARGINGACGPIRPIGFDGRSRIIERGCGYRAGDTWWWSPGTVDDIADEHVYDAFRTARALFNHGMVSIGVRYTIGKDATRRNVITWRQWVGGVEPIEAHRNGRDWYANVAELVGSMLHEFRTKHGL